MAQHNENVVLHFLLAKCVFSLAKYGFAFFLAKYSRAAEVGMRGDPNSQCYY